MASYDPRNNSSQYKKTGAYRPLLIFRRKTMTRLKVAVIAMAVLAAVGCRDRESITGGYGDRVLAGQVAMAAGMPNSSPAGVRVTVGATGMSAVLDATGNFMFVNVPENAELRFTREDGIDAHLNASGTMGPLSVILGSSSASKGRHRSATPAPLKQYEGLVQAISATSIQINGTTLNITKDTVIRKGDKTVQATDIKVGDRVHVKANGDTAAEIIAQTPDDESEPTEDQTMTANGTVTETSASGLKVSTQAHGIVTVNVDSTTIIRKQDKVIGLSDIKVGDEVNTMGTRVDAQTEKAKQIEVRGVSGHK